MEGGKKGVFEWELSPSKLAEDQLKQGLLATYIVLAWICGPWKEKTCFMLKSSGPWQTPSLFGVSCMLRVFLLSFFSLQLWNVFSGLVPSWVALKLHCLSGTHWWCWSQEMGGVIGRVGKLSSKITVIGLCSIWLLSCVTLPVAICLGFASFPICWIWKTQRPSSLLCTMVAASATFWILDLKSSQKP